MLTSLALAIGLGGTVLVLDAPAIDRAEVHAALRTDPVGTLAAALTGDTVVGSGVTVAEASAPPAFPTDGSASGEAGAPGDAAARPVHSTGFSPRSLAAPAIGLTTDVFTTGNTPDGNLEVPSDPQQVGWFRGLAEPGDPGVSVLLGHVDSREGPGVFWRLDELAPGDLVEVERSDGRVVRYEVERVEFHAKDAFPASDVYTSSRDEVLRLITCGGEFDRDRRTYEENVVVTALPVPDRAVSSGRV